METARSIHPHLYRNLVDKSAECDRLAIDRDAEDTRCQIWL